MRLLRSDSARLAAKVIATGNEAGAEKSLRKMGETSGKRLLQASNVSEMAPGNPKQKISPTVNREKI